MKIEEEEKISEIKEIWTFIFLKIWLNLNQR